MSKAYELFKKGKKLIEDGRFLEAVMFLEKAANFEPRKGSIREALGISYYNCGFYNSARDNFDMAIKIDAANDFAHYGMGMCLIKEKNINMAMGHFKIASFMKPDSELYKKTLKKFSNYFIS